MNTNKALGDQKKAGQVNEGEGMLKFVMERSMLGKRI
jgi:hypothetical protein